jgi:broad specificity phosphatase PhoE
MDILNVLWVRHGQSTANIIRRFSHAHDQHPLTYLGEEQAATVSTELNDLGIGGPVFSSPLLRAQQTARLIAKPQSLSVETIEEFRELNVGALDGQEGAEAWAAHDAVIGAWVDGDYEAAFPGGESAFDVSDRMRRGFTRVLEHAKSEPTVVVGHGGNIGIAVRVLDPEAPLVGELPNCGIVRLRIWLDDGRLVLRREPG